MFWSLKSRFPGMLWGLLTLKIKQMMGGFFVWAFGVFFFNHTIDSVKVKKQGRIFEVQNPILRIQKPNKNLSALLAGDRVTFSTTSTGFTVKSLWQNCSLPGSHLQSSKWGSLTCDHHRQPPDLTKTMLRGMPKGNNCSKYLWHQMRELSHRYLALLALQREARPGNELKVGGNPTS